MILFAVTGTIQTSDERTKIILGPLALGTNLLDHLEPVMYRLRNAENKVALVQEGTMLVPRVDEAGAPVMSTDGVPVMDERPRMVEQSTPVEGTRIHLGFTAEGVAASFRALGLYPMAYGVWTLDDPTNPDSRQGLRHEQLIAVLTLSLKQERAVRLAMEQRLAALEAR